MLACFIFGLSEISQIETGETGETGTGTGWNRRLVAGFRLHRFMPVLHTPVRCASVPDKPPNYWPLPVLPVSGFPSLVEYFLLFHYTPYKVVQFRTRELRTTEWLTLLWSALGLALKRSFELLRTYWCTWKCLRAHFLMKFNNSSVHSLFGAKIQIVATRQPLIGIGWNLDSRWPWYRSLRAANYSFVTLAVLVIWPS